VTERTRKQLGILGVLVAVFVAVMFVVSRGEGPAGVGRAPSNRAGQAPPQPTAPQVADVRLELLQAKQDRLADPERNLFVFRPKPAPAPPPRPIESPRPQITAPPMPVGPPPPPPIPLKFIGVLDAPGKGGRFAILSDGRGGTYYGKEGDTIVGQYKVLKIGTESAELSYVDGRGRQTLRLSGQ
jgi:hypothetical protein